MKTVIVGGVAGGATAAARLRRLDEDAQIVLLEKGSHISFANCGLPYYAGGVIEQEEELLLQTPESFHGRFCVDVRVNSEAVEVTPPLKQIRILNRLTGETCVESYDKLILAMGARPIAPALPGLEDERVFLLRTVPDAKKIRDYIAEKKPRSAVIIGGGNVGVEMAENLVHAGLKVSIVEMADHLIAALDPDMAADAQRYLRKQGVELHLKNALRSVMPTGNGLELQLESGTITADMLLLSIGVRPDSELARRAGLVLSARGAIVVDRHMRTSDPDIYAAGDVVESTEFVLGGKGVFALAGPANKQARIAADNICGIHSSYKGAQGSAILKIFDMTVASTGVNERALKASGVDYDKVFSLSPSHAGYYPGSAPMSIKTLFERGSGRILGAQIVGFEGADKRCDVLAAAVRNRLTARELSELELCYAPPFSSAKDPVNIIGNIIENTLSGRVRIFHWHDVASLPRGGVTLLDVRTPEEYAAGAIEGAVNIPLDALRGRLDELDKQKPVYVNCRSGQRSYIACCILNARGFDCRNLSGGYRLYELAVSETFA